MSAFVSCGMQTLSRPLQSWESLQPIGCDAHPVDCNFITVNTKYNVHPLQGSIRRIHS